MKKLILSIILFLIALWLPFYIGEVLGTQIDDWYALPLFWTGSIIVLITSVNLIDNLFKYQKRQK